jgi:hypothetical protein
VSDPALSRRSFVAASTVMGLAAAARARSQPEAGITPATTFPHQPPELVQAVVGASHGNIAKVKELVEKCPPLARASWDWGFGDWESALGAASHTGQREIATYLMERGARPDIFTFAMLGNLPALRAIVEAQPGIQRIPGPHGIPLLQHARAGGPAATETFKYLESLGDAGKEPQNFSLTPEQVAAYTGEYRLEGAGEVTCVIKQSKNQLWIQKGQEPQRGLHNQGAYEFSPAGAPEVRLVFEMKDGKAVSFASRHYEPAFKAVRID